MVASERPVIQTAFNINSDKMRLKEDTLIIKKDGSVKKKIREPLNEPVL